MFGLAESIARMTQDRKGRKLARYLELLQQNSLDDDALDEMEGIGHVLGKSVEVMDRERGAVPQINAFVATLKDKDGLLGALAAAKTEELRSIEKTRIAVAKLWEEHAKVATHARELDAEVSRGTTARQELRRLLDRHPDLRPLCAEAYWPPLILRTPAPEPAVRSGTLDEVTAPRGSVAAAPAAQKTADAPHAPDAAPDAPAAPGPAQAPPAALPVEKPDEAPAPPKAGQPLGWGHGGATGTFPDAFPHDPGDKRRRKH
jgi:hypothetical protein